MAESNLHYLALHMQHSSIISLSKVVAKRFLSNIIFSSNFPNMLARCILQPAILRINMAHSSMCRATKSVPYVLTKLEKPLLQPLEKGFTGKMMKSIAKMKTCSRISVGTLHACKSPQSCHCESRCSGRC